MEPRAVRVSCKNNVQIALVQQVAEMLIDRFVVIITEPDGERFTVLDMRTCMDYSEALMYVEQEQKEHNLDSPAEADWYNVVGAI